MKSIKQAAKTIKSALESMGYKMPTGHSLDLVAKLQDSKDWNVLSAILKMNADVCEAPKEEAVPEWDQSAPMSDAQYVAKMGCHCPSCGSGEIEGNEIQVDTTIAWQEMVCLACGAEWNDTYTLVGYAELEVDSDTDEDNEDAGEGDANNGKESATKPAEKDIGHVSAEAHSDDRAVEVDFNAALWLASASELKISNLSRCGWGRGYAADRVVHDLVFDGGPLSVSLNKILKHGQHMANINQTVGFECTVDENEAMQWLCGNRSKLWEAILVLDVLEAVGIDVGTDDDQPGLWLWTGPSDSCEMSLPSFSEAALDAWKAVVATTMGAKNMSSEAWEALSLGQQLELALNPNL